LLIRERVIERYVRRNHPRWVEGSRRRACGIQELQKACVGRRDPARRPLRIAKTMGRGQG
jgi:hypothetical protein